MTQEEINEIERLTNEYNRLVDRRNRLAQQYNMLVAELEYSIEATAEVITRAAAVQKYIVPRLSGSTEHVTEVAELITAVQNEIDDLSNKYFIIKNISTASKKLTQLNDEYQRKFGLYNTLRRVTLGYVVGVDSNIISNERLRLTAEKNYLQNADYWISHCLMATMLWVSNEEEAANRAVEKAMSIDQHKSALFFLLINLRFGRAEAASKWFEFYIKDINVMNIGDEVRILLQAYLYNICGEDPAFKERIRAGFDQLLQNVKNFTADYNSAIQRRALEFISAHVHKTVAEFAELRTSCEDYRNMIGILEGAEKNEMFAKYFQELYEEDSDAPKNLIERIQNVLYDLISTYDEAEMMILRDMDYNEMILSARGDVAAAKKMYDTKYQPKRPQSFGDLMIKLALPGTNDDVDVRVRKFAVNFLCENIISAFEAFKAQYNAADRTKHKVRVDSFEVVVDEKEPDKAAAQLAGSYKANRNKFIRRDKGVKWLTAFTVIFWIAFAASIGFAAYTFLDTETWSVLSIILFAASFLLAVGFTVWLILRRKKVGLHVSEMMEKALEKLDRIVKEIAEWRALYTAADEKSVLVREVLEKFMISEEEGQ